MFYVCMFFFLFLLILSNQHEHGLIDVMDQYAVLWDVYMAQIFLYYIMTKGVKIIITLGKLQLYILSFHCRNIILIYFLIELEKDTLTKTMELYLVPEYMSEYSNQEAKSWTAALIRATFWVV